MHAPLFFSASNTAPTLPHSVAPRRTLCGACRRCRLCPRPHCSLSRFPLSLPPLRACSLPALLGHFVAPLPPQVTVWYFPQSFACRALDVSARGMCPFVARRTRHSAQGAGAPAPRPCGPPSCIPCLPCPHHVNYRTTSSKRAGWEGARGAERSGEQAGGVSGVLSCLWSWESRTSVGQSAARCAAHVHQRGDKRPGVASLPASAPSVRS